MIKPIASLENEVCQMPTLTLKGLFYAVREGADYQNNQLNEICGYACKELKKRLGRDGFIALCQSEDMLPC